MFSIIRIPDTFRCQPQGMISSQLSGAAGTTRGRFPLVGAEYQLLFGIPVFWRNQPNTHFNVVKLYQAAIESQARG